MVFKKRLYDLRVDNDMTQYDLAQRLNLKASAISKYEKGITEPSISTLIKIAEIFECSIDYLLGLSIYKKVYSSEKLASQEINIIARYRRLSKENRIRIDERINALLDKQHLISR